MQFQYFRGPVLTILCLIQSGCIGAAIGLSGKNLDVSRGYTPHELEVEFGSPVEIIDYQPSRELRKVSYYLESLDSVDVDTSDDSTHVIRIARYRYIGPVDQSGTQAGMMWLGIEGTWTVLTLGIAQLYYIPHGSQVAKRKQDDVTEFVVAFDESNRSVWSSVVLFDP